MGFDTFEWNCTWAPPSESPTTAYGLPRIWATASVSMLISPRLNTVSSFSSTARSRNASIGCLPCAWAISATCLPASPRFFASFGSSTIIRSQRLEKVESGAERRVDLGAELRAHRRSRE